jgi:hypothetical protein
MGRSETLKQYLGREEKFIRALRQRGHVGHAFKALCAAGCDADQLARLLFHLSGFPAGKGQRRYTASDRRKLERIANKVEQAASELDAFEDLLFHESFGGLNFREQFADWEQPVQIPTTLRHLATGISKCAASTRASYRTQPYSLSLYTAPSVYEYIPRIVAYVRDKTGKPRYAELATVIGFSIDKPLFNVEELKMICARRQDRKVERKK